MYNIIGLDLSKKNTGISIFTLSEDLEIKLNHLEGYSHPQYELFNKFYFVAKDFILDYLDNLVEEKNLKSENTMVSLEMPIYHSFASELQFYLSQEILKWARKNSFNLVGYSPLFIKSFASQCLADKSLNRKDFRKSKDFIKKAYDHLRSLNKDMMPELLKKNHDEIDAFFIGLLGTISAAWCFSKAFEKEKYAYNTYQNSLMSVLLEDHPMMLELNVYTTKDYYSEFFRYYFNNIKFKGFTFNKEGVPWEVQFKTAYKNLLKNGHLRMDGSFFYPFYNLDRMRELIESPQFEKYNPEGKWMKEMLGWKTKDILGYEKSEFTPNLGLTQQGQIFWIKDPMQGNLVEKDD